MHLHSFPGERGKGCGIALSELQYRFYYQYYEVRRERRAEEAGRLIATNFYNRIIEFHNVLDSNTAVPSAKMREEGLSCETFPSVQEAVMAAKTAAGDDDVIFITGSCFVVGEALQIFNDYGL